MAARPEELADRRLRRNQSRPDTAPTEPAPTEPDRSERSRPDRSGTEMARPVRSDVDIDRDRRLVVAYQHGDRAAFDELYQRYHDRLLRYCQSRVRDHHVAEELTQETFLRALEALPRFTGDRRFYPWLTVIAGRLCIDHHRRNGRVDPSPTVDTGAVEPDHDAVFVAVDHAHLRQAIHRLAPRHREVLALREERRWSYQRIADHLQVPNSTVEALLHRARRALRREFFAVGGGRVAALPVVSGLIIGIGRFRSRVAGMPSEQLTPWAASAAAGVAAVSLAVGGLGGDVKPGDGDTFGPTSTVVVGATSADGTAPAPGPPPAPVPVTALPSSAPMTVGRPATTAQPVADVTVRPVAPPTLVAAIDLGIVTVYPGFGGRAHGDERTEDMPIRIDLGPVANIGIDLEAFLGGADGPTAPGGTP